MPSLCWLARKLSTYCKPFSPQVFNRCFGPVIQKPKPRNVISKLWFDEFLQPFIQRTGKSVRLNYCNEWSVHLVQLFVKRIVCSDWDKDSSNDVHVCNCEEGPDWNWFSSLCILLELFSAYLVFLHDLLLHLYYHRLLHETFALSLQNDQEFKPEWTNCLLDFHTSPELRTIPARNNSEMHCFVKWLNRYELQQEVETRRSSGSCIACLWGHQ